MNDQTKMGIVGILCLTCILVAALFNGIDGVLIGSIAGIIGTIVGYAFGKTTQEKVTTNAPQTT